MQAGRQDDEQGAGHVGTGSGRGITIGGGAGGERRGGAGGMRGYEGI